MGRARRDAGAKVGSVAVQFRLSGVRHLQFCGTFGW